MSYLARAITQLLAVRNLTQADLCALAALSSGHISKLCNGVQKWISPDDLARIATVLGRTKVERAELVRAHLLDECSGPGSELVRVVIKGETAGDEPAPHVLPPLPPKLAAACAVLSKEALVDSDLRSLLIHLANLSGSKEATA